MRFWNINDWATTTPNFLSNKLNKISWITTSETLITVIIKSKRIWIILYFLKKNLFLKFNLWKLVIFLAINGLKTNPWLRQLCKTGLASSQSINWSHSWLMRIIRIFGIITALKRSRNSRRSARTEFLFTLRFNSGKFLENKKQ